MTLPLKYRPSALNEVIGQAHVVAALQPMLATNRIPQALLMTGPSGVGKTTIARIVAARVDGHLVQIDAASYSGVESMRQIVGYTRYSMMGSRATLIEECHALSIAAWQALLLPLEEPPRWAYWILCTTEPHKVPAPVRTRCHTFHLRSVTRPVLLAHLASVVKRERLTVEDGVLEACAEAANGSVRQALVNLERSHYLDRRAARELLREPRAPKARKNGADVVAMVKQGMTRDEIGQALGKDRTTVWRKLTSAIDAGLITEQEIQRA